MFVRSAGPLSRKEIFDTALKDIQFKPGYDILTINGYSKAEDRENFHLNTLSPVKNRDLRFKRDAHLFPDTKIVAAEGPQCDELETFFLDTAFNTNHPIEHIIAMGFGKFSYSESEDKTIDPNCLLPSDFINYATLAFEAQEPENASFAVKGKLLSSSTLRFNHEITSKVHDIEVTVKHSAHPNQQKTLSVTNFQLPDNEYFDTLFDDEQHSLKTRLWNMFLIVLQKNTLVHCRAGLGRTGHIVLFFEALKMLINGQLNEQNPEKIAAILLARLDDMRKLRPAFVLNEVQFKNAIRNAVDVYEFALKNKLLNQEVVKLCKAQQAEIKVRTPQPEPVLKLIPEPKGAPSRNGLFSCKNLAASVLGSAVILGGLAINAYAKKL